MCAVSWSPKGKQIAVGLQSGDIITFSPTETNKPKFVFGKPPSANNQSVIALTWLSNPTIHAIYAPPGELQPDAQQTHIVLSLDMKKNQASDVKLATPYYPSPGIRSPGPFTVVLKNWDPTKFILIIGDSSSSDIGIIGGAGEDMWYNFSLEETSTPSLPLDKDMNDTVLVALELDLTSAEPYHHAGSGEPSELPPPPILYAYASDGTVLGWHIVNSQGQAYPGMASGSAANSFLSVPAMTSSISQNDMQMSSAPITPVSGPTSAFGQQPPSQSAFGQFAQPQPSTSAFDSSATPSAFGQPSTFGQQQQSSLAFGQPSTFGQAVSNGSFQQVSGSPFGANTSSRGFGAFSSAGPAKFGQSVFGASPSPTLPGSPPPPPLAEDSMAADDGPSFDGLSLGDTSQADKSVSAFGSGSIFGNPTMPQNSDPTNETSAGNSSSGFSAIKPATGFGAFANLSSHPSGFGGVGSKDSLTLPETPKPSSAFGKSGFETKPSGPFGQSVFGQSGFGQSSGSVFGKTSFGTVNTTAAVGGGFSAFAASGTSSFTSAASQAKSEQPASGGFSAFTHNGPSSFTSAISQKNEDSKPVWVSDGPTGALGPSRSSPEDDSKSVIGSGPDNGGTINAGSTTIGMMQVKDEPDDTGLPPSPKNTSRVAVPASSESLPADTGPSPFGNADSTTPISSPFKSSAPSSGTGAFGQLKTSSTGFFKPAEGFGAFGSVINKDSPFYNPPKEVGTKPVSVFSNPSTPASTAPKTGSTTPAFGSPSVIGSSKPTFGSTSVLGSTSRSPLGLPVVTPASEPSSGGFGAFSGKSGFAAFAGKSASSFGDLLRGGNEAKDLSKPKIPAVGNPPKHDSTSVFAPEKLEQEKHGQSSQFSAGSTSTSKPSAPGSPTHQINQISSTLVSAQDLAASNSPKLSLTQTTSTPEARTKDQLEEVEPKRQDENSATSSEGFHQTIITSSLASVSATSQSSSFVDVSAPSDEEGSASRPEIPDRPTDSGSDLEDDTQSFLSESFSDESPDDELSDEEAADEDEDQPHSSSVKDSVEHPTDILSPSTPLPRSRSPSKTPKPGPSSLQLSKSPSPPPTSPSPAISSTPARPVRAGSTTPPESPPQETLLASLPKVPPPGSVQSAPPPFSLGLGRPSTRPTRSSPLANAPLSSDVDETSKKAVSSRLESSVIPKPASPKQPFGILGAEQTQKSTSLVDSKAGEPQPKRPRTPPLLSVGTVSTEAAIRSTHSSTSTLPSNALINPSRSLTTPSPPSSSTSVASEPVGSRSPSFLGDRSAAPSPTTPPAPGNISGRPPVPTPSPIPNFFVQKRTISAVPTLSSTATGSLDGTATAPTPPCSGKQDVVVVSASPDPPGMQAECVFLVNELGGSLDEV